MGQPALAGMTSSELEDFVGAKCYCLHALVDSNKHIRIREKTPELSNCLRTADDKWLINACIFHMNHKQQQSKSAHLLRCKKWNNIPNSEKHLSTEVLLAMYEI